MQATVIKIRDDSSLTTFKVTQTIQPWYLSITCNIRIAMLCFAPRASHCKNLLQQTLRVLPWGPGLTCGNCTTHDTHSRNRRHKSTPFFWHQFLVRVSCISGTGFVWYQIQAPIRTLFYSKPESGMHVTEMMTYDWPMITVMTVCARNLHSRPYGTKNWCQKKTESI